MQPSPLLGMFDCFERDRYHLGKEMSGFSQQDEHVWDPNLYMSPARFAARMEVLTRSGCNVLRLDEAIELANSTQFGLGANIYTRDLRNILRCMREIKSGTVWFNDPLTDNDAGPFGGMKMSGNARELGPEGLAPYLRLKTIYLR